MPIAFVERRGWYGFSTSVFIKIYRYFLLLATSHVRRSASDRNRVAVTELGVLGTVGWGQRRVESYQSYDNFIGQRVPKSRWELVALPQKGKLSPGSAFHLSFAAQRRRQC